MPRLYYEKLLKFIEANKEILKYRDDGSDGILYLTFTEQKCRKPNAQTLNFEGVDGTMIILDINDAGQVKGIEFY